MGERTSWGTTGVRLVVAPLYSRNFTPLHFALLQVLVDRKVIVSHSQRIANLFPHFGKPMGGRKQRIVIKLSVSVSMARVGVEDTPTRPTEESQVTPTTSRVSRVGSGHQQPEALVDPH